jgi:hypothetical protein
MLLMRRRNLFLADSLAEFVATTLKLDRNGQRRSSCGAPDVAAMRLKMRSGLPVQFMLVWL